MNRTSSAVACLAAIVISLAAAAPAMAAELWTENAKDALAQAVKEKKDVLIDFTGSDWCGWCIKLDKEVFSQDAFITVASKNFVFLKLDFPKKKQLSEDIKKQNDEWNKKFAVQGFPTIVLADSSGRPYAVTGYQKGGPEAYLKHLEELRAVRVKRDQTLAKAAEAKGAAKAKLLDEAISGMELDPGVILNCYGDQIAEIVKLDADGKAGLKAKYENLLTLGKLDAAFQEGKFDDVIKMADESLKTLGNKGEPAQMILFIKAIALVQKKDKAGCKKVLDEALKAAPESQRAAQIKQVIEKIDKDVPENK